MTSVSFFSHPRCAMTAAGAALAIAIAIPAAMAQQAGDREYYQGNGETVEVIAPPPAQRTSIGAPIENVALSKAVRTDDLDLRTRWGVHALRTRISTTARMLCRRMNTMYVPLSDNPPCYRTTVRAAWRQARAAIDDAHYAD